MVHSSNCACQCCDHGKSLEEPVTTIAEMEKRLIFRALGHTGHNRAKASRLLGISARTLRNKLHEYLDGKAEDGQ